MKYSLSENEYSVTYYSYCVFISETNKRISTDRGIGCLS